MGLKDFFVKRREKIKIADIRQYLFQQMLLNAVDFKKVSGRDNIARKKEYGADTFQIMIHTRKYGYAIEAGAHKRFDELEAVYAEFKRDKEFWKYTVTIGGGLGDLLDKPLPKGYQVVPNYEYEIVTRHDLEKITKKMIGLFQKTETAFFEKFNTYQELYDIVNVDIRNCGKYDGNYFDKALLGLTLSRLLKDENYEVIKETYLSQVEKSVPGDIPKYYGLIEKLEKEW